MALPISVVVIVGLLMHCVYLLGVFDVYFHSPIVHGVSPHVAQLPPLAHRLVLISLDGLRADKLFEYRPGGHGRGQPRAPFLHSVVDNVGSWGVSHTHVPTESRPGHVAMIAGLYEDPSAVTRGWQDNPVEFDSVFNASIQTYGWGSPDILDMFSKPEHIHMHMYPSEFQDFSQDGYQLDKWVFDEFERFVEDAMQNETKKERLAKKQTVFFLHLLGIDTQGHAHRPHSHEYLRNIELVDRGIVDVYEKVEALFPDGKTAYIVTSDHGMHARGNHGDGHPTNTETPLVAWGCGIAKATARVASLPHCPVLDSTAFPQSSPPEWHVDHRMRADVEQADIAPLMAALLGVRFPVNSVGVLPTSYLQCTAEEKLELLATNLRQIDGQLGIKATRRKEQHGAFFTPYSQLEADEKEEIITRARLMLAEGKMAEGECAIREGIHQTMKALRYYHTYDRSLLLCIISLGFAGWIAYALLYVFFHYTIAGNIAGKTGHTVTQMSSVRDVLPWETVVVGGVACAMLGFYNTAWHYMMYALFPSFFFGQIIAVYAKPLCRLVGMSIGLMGEKRRVVVISSVLGQLGVVVVLMQSLYLSYYNRETLSVATIIMALWAFGIYFQTKEWSALVMCIQSAVMSGFLFLSTNIVDEETRQHCKILGIFAAAVLVISVQWFTPHSLRPGVGERVCENGHARVSEKGHRLSQGAGLIYAVLSVVATIISFLIASKGPVQSEVMRKVSQTFSWALLVLAPTVHVFFSSAYYNAIELESSGSPGNVGPANGTPWNQGGSLAASGWTGSAAVGGAGGGKRERMLAQQSRVALSLFMAILTPYILLSVTYEVLFLVLFALWLFVWARVEVSLDSREEPGSEGAGTEDGGFRESVSRSYGMFYTMARRSIFYLVLCHMGFFGMGNFASLTSFELSSTYCFISVFSPFVMGFLLLVKVILPFLLLLLATRVISESSACPPKWIFLTVVAIADIIALGFFFTVRDEGSWFDIGQSISRYAMADVNIISQLVLFSLGGYLTGYRQLTSTSNQKPHNT